VLCADSEVFVQDSVRITDEDRIMWVDWEVYLGFIGVDLAGLLGDAWRAPKVDPCRVG